MRGVIYNNNSIICITEIGEVESATNNALQCITDRMPCCQTPPNRYGEWYFPNGELVGLRQNRPDPFNTFYRNRGDDGAVNLNHVGSTLNRTNSPVGLFCCRVPDSTNVIQQICVYIGEFLHVLITITAASFVIKVAKYFSIVLVSLQLMITGSVDTPTAGESYSLTCTLSRSEACLLGYMASYQWQKDGNILANETAVVLSFSPFRLSHGGRYTCEVTVGNTMFSDNRELTIARKTSTSY